MRVARGALHTKVETITEKKITFKFSISITQTKIECVWKRSPLTKEEEGENKNVSSTNCIEKRDDGVVCV